MFARKSISAAFEASDSLGSELTEHVQLDVVGVRDVEVVVVVAAPEEGLATFDLFDVVGVDAAVVEERVLRLAEVRADGTDQPHVGEEAGGQRKVNG